MYRREFVSLENELIEWSNPGKLSNASVADFNATFEGQVQVQIPWLRWYIEPWTDHLRNQPRTHNLEIESGIRRSRHPCIYLFVIERVKSWKIRARLYQALTKLFNMHAHQHCRRTVQQRSCCVALYTLPAFYHQIKDSYVVPNFSRVGTVVQTPPRIVSLWICTHQAAADVVHSRPLFARAPPCTCGITYLHQVSASNRGFTQLGCSLPFVHKTTSLFLHVWVCLTRVCSTLLTTTYSHLQAPTSCPKQFPKAPVTSCRFE